MSAVEKLGAQWDRSPLYHITDNPKFALDPNYRPENNAVSISRLDSRMPPGVFLTRHPEAWVNGHNYVRPYVAEIRAHEDLRKALGVSGGFSGETFVPAEHYDKLRIDRVIPLDAHAREEYGGHGWIEEHHGTAFDDNSPITPQRGNISPHPGYKYSGPDVRDMDAASHERHAGRWKQFMSQSRGIEI